MLRKTTTTGGQSTSSASSSSSRLSRLSAKLSRPPSRKAQGDKLCDDDYVNPLESVARWRLSTHAYALRSGAAFAFNWGNRSAPVPPSPSRSIYLDSTLSEWKDKDAIRVDMYEPSAAVPIAGKVRSAVDPAKRIGVINFHGGGFILGSGTDDARWASAVVESLDAVVFSVNYRLAPGYPYPTPVEDTIDAILQLHARAAEFGIDPDRILLSGFSAGGTLALAAWVVLQDPSRWNYTIPSAPPIAGLALFYPLLDWTTSRPVKRRLCPKPHETLPKSMTDLFDASYIYPSIPRDGRDDPRLSPGLMPLEYMERMPPVHLCLCEMDMLLTEGLKFADSLREAGRLVTSRVVLGEKHAWDKPPPFAPKESMSIEYQAAIMAMRHWVNEDGEKLTKADVGSVSVSDRTEVADGASLDMRPGREMGERDQNDREGKKERMLPPAC
ncbi:hypothetical protein ACHAQA_006318 [Verticillium albo-atrum]